MNAPKWSCREPLMSVFSLAPDMQLMLMVAGETSRAANPGTRQRAICAIAKLAVQTVQI